METYTAPCKGLPEYLECDQEAEGESPVDKIISMEDCLDGKVSGNAQFDPSKAMDAYDAAMEALDTCTNSDEPVVNILSLHVVMWAVFWPSYASARL